ncbi:MAG: hypothetical protein HBSAPP03_08300 [Phycisphaerae bacterium]|nr:MAG: hypothetical protein HBSAPP03_08300 [Phycisphaerae bacterium]
MIRPCRGIERPRIAPGVLRIHVGDGYRKRLNPVEKDVVAERQQGGTVLGHALFEIEQCHRTRGSEVVVPPPTAVQIPDETEQYAHEQAAHECRSDHKVTVLSIEESATA